MEHDTARQHSSRGWRAVGEQPARKPTHYFPGLPPRRKKVGEPRDMMSTSEGGRGHGNADVVGRLHKFYTTNMLKWGQGGGGLNPKIMQMSLMVAH